MAKLEIVKLPDPRLRQVCQEVDSFTSELQDFIQDMYETMYLFDGCGLAAPQVGHTIRAIVMDIHNDPDRRMCLINPVIHDKKGKATFEEGCLSMPGIYPKVPRANEIVLDYYDEHGKFHQIEAIGLHAVCIQHEVDHLDGILSIDYLSPFKRKRMIDKLKKLGKIPA